MFSFSESFQILPVLFHYKEVILGDSEYNFYQSLVNRNLHFPEHCFVPFYAVMLT